MRLTRCNDEEAPLIDTSYSELFEAVGVLGVLQIYEALITEGRVIFVSDDLKTLANCSHAAVGMLYPFTFQHVFVPILPATWLEYVTAPMPFCVGIHSSLLDRALQLPIDSAVLVVQIDSGTIGVCGEVNADAPKLPPELYAQLEKG